MNTAALKIMSLEEYLAWEEQQPTKHEFLNGLVYDVYAMTGAKDTHVTVALNVASLCKSHLRGTPCRTFLSDMKLQVETANASFYPDVFVTCDERDRGSEYHKSHPVLIVEVLSPSTAGFDRGSKFAAYRQIDSLKEYALIDPANFSVDLFRKNDSGHWVLYPYQKEGIVEFTSIDLKAPFEAIFEDVERAQTASHP